MTDTTITLISPGTRTRDAEGVWRDGDPVRREVYARKMDVSRAEFFSGGQAGFRPELMFLVFRGNYQGEAVAEYDGVLYAIYRHYNPEGSDDIELYLRREVGVHGAQNGA